VVDGSKIQAFEGRSLKISSFQLVCDFGYFGGKES